MFTLQAMFVKENNRNLNKFSRILSCLLLFLSFCGVLSAESVSDARTLQIKTGHPVILVDSDIISAAQAKTSLMSSFAARVKSYNPILNVSNPTVEQIRQAADALTDGILHPHEGHYLAYIVAMPGVYALLTGDSTAVEYCRQICESILARPVNYGSGDGYPTGTLLVLGTFHDWFFYEFSSDLRSRIQQRILDGLDDVENRFHYYSNNYFSGGHAHYASMYGLVGLLAIRHDISGQSSAFQTRYFDWLKVIANRWLDGYNPMYKWIGVDGGHNMGIGGYAPTYTRMLPYMVWGYATDEPSWFDDEWQNQRTYYFLYGLRNFYAAEQRALNYGVGAYDTFPFFGDSYGTAYYSTNEGSEIFNSALIYGNPHAAWLYKSFPATDYWLRLFYEPADLDWNAISSSPENLPLSRLFRNTGVVTMRDAWDNSNTLMLFNSSSFYSHNHQHKDQNAFTLYYKGPLAIDSGAYSAMGEYNSVHWWNYYIRTVAHNSILVYNPSENFGTADGTGAQLSNDGGQKFFGKGGNAGTPNPTLAQMQDGGVNHLDGIVKYENDLDYTYSVGNATKAYRSDKVTDFTRSVVYLRNHSYEHPAVVIYDNVTSTNASFKKTYLLHSINEPAVDSTTVTVQNDDGISTSNKSGLYQETILPANAALTVVGGRANNQEFLVQNDGFGNPRNYNDEADYDTTNTSWQRAYREAGQWRVEVCPGSNNLTDRFMHVLSVVDDPATHSKVTAQYVSSTNLDGVILTDKDGAEKTLALFQKQTGTLSAQTIDLTGKNIFNYILLTGLQANVRFSINISGSSLQIATDTAGGYRSSSQGVIYCPVDKLSNGLGLLGHWHMNETSWNNTSGEIVDTTGNNSGTGKNGASTSESRYNRGGIFNGTINCYAHLTRNAALNPQDAITFSAWVNTNQVSGVNCYAGIRNWSYAMRTMGTGSSLPCWGIYAAGASAVFQSVSDSTPLVAGQWTHLVGSYDSNTKELVLYRNGVEVNRRTLSGLSNYKLNQSTTSDLLAGSGFNGMVDEVAVWNRALAPEEITLLYNSYAWRTGLLGHWRMNETVWNNTSGEIVDTTGNNNGAGKNGATTSESRFNRGGIFNGTINCYAHLTRNAALNPQDAITFSAWVNTNQVSGVNCYAGIRNWSYAMRTMGTGSSLPCWGIYAAGANTVFQSVSDTPPLVAGQLTHLAGAYDANTKTLVLYRNGVEVNRRTLSGLSDYKLNQSTTSDLLAGSGFSGMIDEVAVWSRALDADEIYAIYQEGLGGDLMN